MARALVCVLGTGDWSETNKAVASALKLGLEVLVGVTGQTDKGTPHAGARVVPIEWRDDFADARNQLAARAEADYLIWLDSDEELLSFPRIDWGRVRALRFSVLIQDRTDLAPREIVRIQRNHSSARWQGAIHEELTLTSNPELDKPMPLGGAAIIHWGYEDEARMKAKIERNHRIARAERAQGKDYSPLALEEAAYEEAFGRGAFLAWLRAFKHPGAAPAGPLGFDRRYGAAGALCDYDYLKPALIVLAQNPLILGLQMAVLAAQYRVTGGFDEERRAFLCRTAALGLGDRRYRYPLALLGADRERITEVIKAAAEQSEARHAKRAAKRSRLGDGMTTFYKHTDGFDQETLEEDLILMNTETFEVVTLNPTAQAVWDVLKTESSIDELVSTFAEAFPDKEPEDLRRDVTETVQTLLAAKLVVETGATSGD